MGSFNVIQKWRLNANGRIASRPQLPIPTRKILNIRILNIRVCLCSPHCQPDIRVCLCSPHCQPDIRGQEAPHHHHHVPHWTTIGQCAMSSTATPFPSPRTSLAALLFQRETGGSSYSAVRATHMSRSSASRCRQFPLPLAGWRLQFLVPYLRADLQLCGVKRTMEAVPAPRSTPRTLQLLLPDPHQGLAAPTLRSTTQRTNSSHSQIDTKDLQLLLPDTHRGLAAPTPRSTPRTYSSHSQIHTKDLQLPIPDTHQGPRAPQREQRQFPLTDETC